MLGEIICPVEFSSLPVDVELSLSDAVTYPVEAHIDGLGPFLFDCIVGYSRRGCVVCAHGGSWLFVSQFFKGSAERTGLFTVVEKCRQFGFCRTGYYGAEDGANDVDGCIELGFWRVLVELSFWLEAEVVVASDA